MGAAPANTFLQRFYANRAEYAVPTGQIQATGKGTKAYPNGEDEQWWLDHGPGMVENYERWRDTCGWRIWEAPDGTPAIELALLANVGIDLPIKMFIDRIFVSSAEGEFNSNQLVIVDLKSGARSPVSDLQLGVYRVGVLETFGVRIDWGAYFDARRGVLSRPVNLKRYTPSLLCHWFRQAWDAHKQKIFIPNLSNWCRSCSVRDYCAAYGGSNAHFDPDYRFITGEEE